MLPGEQENDAESTESSEVVLIEDKTPAPSGISKALGGLAKQDPLARYMRDVEQYPLLNREEEAQLARKYADEGDLDAARRLVTSNLRLVVKIAYQYRQAYRNILDLVQEGNIGLMEAVRKYDPYRGVKLSTYAAWWIRAYMLKYILNNHRMVKLGTTQAQRKLFFNLKKERAKLEAMGIEPTAALVAEALNVPEREVKAMEGRMLSADTSLDAQVTNHEGEGVARVTLLESNTPPVDDAIADAELGDVLGQKLRTYGDTLTGKERAIFDKRLIADDPVTLQDLGTEFGVSRERVRQIEKRLLEKMRVYLKAELGEGVVDVYSE